MKITIQKVFLFLSGLTGMYIGASLLFNPVAFEASADIPVAANVNLLSEIRSSGGIIFTTGILIGLGSMLKNQLKLSLILSALFYLSYGVSRLVAMLLDGIPGSSLVYVSIAELIIGTISLCFLIYTSNQKKDLAV